ncbi:GNAT family N-acetyltransferase [Leucobacter allii]|uniref:GNAT family N-acetyltransferase n=1 Tax=Leucobacter allii TaxID=2932247 RepID=A0ABY4FIJ7_9MICO|nr:GNAT family N-acetyltransferase [Leucobacter allii]UOQ56513.1 GNAT family N-acetyltransferase [Leucobacter allii]
MNASIRIRPARPEEHAETGALVRAAYAADFALGAEYLAEIEDVAGRATSSEVLVAVEADPETGERILATVTIPRPGERLQDDTEPGEMDLRLLGVAHAARGRGIGEAVVRHCLRVARDRGCHRVVLHTGEIMTGAQRLYERLGFTRIPEREFDIEVLGGTRRILAYGLALTGVRVPA